jgi:hypothetical protein
LTAVIAIEFLVSESRAVFENTPTTVLISMKPPLDDSVLVRKCILAATEAVWRE